VRWVFYFCDVFFLVVVLLFMLVCLWLVSGFIRFVVVVWGFGGVLFFVFSLVGLLVVFGFFWYFCFCLCFCFDVVFVFVVVVLFLFLFGLFGGCIGSFWFCFFVFLVLCWAGLCIV